jgi:hypothetical protein
MWYKNFIVFVVFVVVDETISRKVRLNPNRGIPVNSLTPKCIPAGMKNSHSEDFLLVQHTSHKHPHHDEPFSRLAAWFWWTNIPQPGSLFARGWTRPP